MNTAAKGRKQEHRSKALLESVGYRVTRAAGSMGEWDLVGIGPTDVVLVQVRTRDWPGPLERGALAEFPVPPDTRSSCIDGAHEPRLPDLLELP